MERITKISVKVIIEKSEHTNRKKIVDAIKKAIENLRTKDVTLIEVKETK